jgi:hypothetical protein
MRRHKQMREEGERDQGKDVRVKGGEWKRKDDETEGWTGRRKNEAAFLFLACWMACYHVF